MVHSNRRSKGERERKSVGERGRGRAVLTIISGVGAGLTC